jgi:hypothetical protein
MLSGFIVAFRMYETLPSKQGISEKQKTDEISGGKQEQYTQPLVKGAPGRRPCVGCPQAD